MSETFKKVLLALIILVFIPVWVPIILQFSGFYVNQPGWKVAQIAAEKRNVKLCSKIWIMPWKAAFSPSSFDQMETCIHEYSSITHDPTVCELLMPSSYGMDCVGSVWGPMIDESNCHWYKENSVRCFEGVKLVPHIFDCSEGDPSSLIDECKHRLAFKKKDPNFCGPITNPILRSVCKIRVETWNKYPSLRNTMYFNDDIR